MIRSRRRQEVRWLQEYHHLEQQLLQMNDILCVLIFIKTNQLIDSFNDWLSNRNVGKWEFLDIFGWTALVTRWIHWITVKLPSPTFNFREYINLFLTNSIFSFSFLPSPLRHDMLGLFFHQMGENLADPIFATFGLIMVEIRIRCAGPPQSKLNRGGKLNNRM